MINVTARYSRLRLDGQIVQLNVIPFRSQRKHSMRMVCVLNRSERLAVERSCNILPVKAQFHSMPFVAVDRGRSRPRV